MTAPAQAQTHDLRRVIGLFGGTALIVGITIGSGIFRVMGGENGGCITGAGTFTPYDPIGRRYYVGLRLGL